MTSRSGAEDAAVPEDPGSGAEEGHRGHGTKEEVHELQREEAELVKDEAEGKDFVSSAESCAGLPGFTHVCVCLCACVQWKKAEEKLEKELLEAEASESKEKKVKLVSPVGKWKHKANLLFVSQNPK